ncbi:hypothetical protein Tco_1059938 [Tanacetum coccineum]
MVKLTTFAVMCKAYGGEPTVDLLWSFLNLGPASDWLTLSNRGDADLLLSANKLDKKSFKDKVPLHPEMDPLYDQIATYPCIVQTFLDHILYFAGLKTTWEHSPKRPIIYHQEQEMDFRSFMLEGVDGEFNFLLVEGVSEGQNSSSTKSNVADSDDPSYEEDEKTLVGPYLPPHLKDSKKLKVLGKRKVASGVPKKALPLKVQKVSARASKVVGEASTPLDVDSDSDIHGVKGCDRLPLGFSHVTPPSWKQNLREISIEQLCDIHDRAYMRQLDKDRAYAELERKCNEALQDLEKNHLVSDMHSLKQDRVAIVSKVIPDAAIKLVRSDDLGVLISKLVRSSIIYGRCQAFEEVAAMKEPFVLEKMSGYQPSSKEEYDQARDALANSSYPFLAEYVINLYASLEQLLSKKPPSLRPIFSESHSKPLSSKVK